MPDGALLKGTDPVALQRARGHALVRIEQRAGRSRLAVLRQQGSAKALLPKVYDDVPQVVLINTCGGITGGDRFSYDVSVGAGASLSVTTQAAERLYRASGDVGHMDVRLRADADANLEWLPQETIVFDESQTRRCIEVDLAADASFLAVEPLVFGRAAMGERLVQAGFDDFWRIRRCGKLVHAEAFRMQGLVEPILRGTAALNNTIAIATIVYSAADAMDRLDGVRAHLSFDGVEARASAWNGQLVCRFAAADNQPLRKALISFLTEFRGRDLPRVWHM